jgi:hypothetical protein
MPRLQLPWVRQPPQPTKPRRQPDIDDDFFDDTVLSSYRKGKGGATAHQDESDDKLPELPTEPSTPRTKSRTKDASRRNRLPSSSPPPIQDYIQPLVEPMRKGASKFDLRDDEWMMVEDEFLDTAKLFTRHLHIAEYEKLKERIEAKNREQVEATRPVVDVGKLSFEGKMKEKAKVQEKTQRKALRDVFASQNDNEDEDDDAMGSRSGSGKTASSFNAPSRAASTALNWPAKPSARDTDSDDLDAPKLSQRTMPKPRAAPMMQPVSSILNAAQSATRPQSKSVPAPASTTSSFAKTAPPASNSKARSTVRRSRITPFDDGYVAPTTPLPRQSETPTFQRSTSSALPSSPVKPIVTKTERKAARSVDVSDDWGARSRETTERLAKRKAEREATAKKKKKVELDEIPTFVF